MKKSLKTTMSLSLCAAMMIPLLAACNSGSAGGDKSERVLRIGTTTSYGPNDEYFRQRFTELYEFSNKNVKVEVVSANDDRSMYGYARPENPDQKPEDPVAKLKGLMQGANPPDVVVVGYEQLPDLLADNLLTQLDPQITKDKFDLEGFVPSVLEGIKKLGDGKVYGLAPTFSSSALIYNKKLFDEAGVPYPKDKMTWEEMTDLARRVSKGEGANRKYGFSFTTYSTGGDVFSSGSDVYTIPLDLKMFDDKGDKMAVDTDQWEKAWKALLQFKSEKLVPEPIDRSNMNAGPQDYNPLEHDDFLSGRVAMAVVNYWDLDRILAAFKGGQNIKGFTPFEWDFVTVPVHQEAPDVGGQLNIDGVFAINKNAQNLEDAWNYIKFVNGEDWAKLKSSSTSSMVSRAKYIKKRDGFDYNLAAFTTLKPALSNDYKLYREKQNLYYVRDIGAKVFRDVAQNKLQVRDGLKKWQSEGDALLQKIKDNPNGPMEMPGIRG